MTESADSSRQHAQTGPDFQNGLGAEAPSRAGAEPGADPSVMGRRMLMAGAGLLGAAALARVAQAGPLNPPTGPIASTGRTTTEAYEAARKGWIEINATNTPGSLTAAAVITQPGYYFLSQNLNALPGQSAAIQVTVGGVVVDLNGFALNMSTSAATAAGFLLTGYPGSGGIVRNGRVHVRNGGTGVQFECDGMIVEDIEIVCELTIAQAANGINVRGSLGSIIRRCQVVPRGDNLMTVVMGVSGCTGTTVEDCVLGGYGTIRAGCELPGSNLVRRCRFFQTSQFGVSLSNNSVVQDCVFSGATGTAINVGTGSTVERCVVQCSGASSNGIAIGSSSRVAHCKVDMLVAQGTCIKGNGGSSFITDNELTRANIAIDLTGYSGCMVFRNQVLGCTNAIAVNFGGNWYPNYTTAGINAATNPFANFFG